VLAVGIGVGSTLAWQAYGDAAREKIADAYPQLAWLAPRAAAAASTGSAVAGRPVADQQLQELSLGLAAMRQRVEQLSLQVSSSQDQLTAKLQASERDILDRIAAQPRMDVTAARKPQPQSTQLH